MRTDLEEARRRYQQTIVAVGVARRRRDDRIHDALAGNFINNDAEEIVRRCSHLLQLAVKNEDAAGDRYEALRRGEYERRIAADLKRHTPATLERCRRIVGKRKRSAPEQVIYDALARFVLVRDVSETAALGRVLGCDPRTIRAMRIYAAADARPWNHSVAATENSTQEQEADLAHLKNKADVVDITTARRLARIEGQLVAVKRDVAEIAERLRERFPTSGEIAAAIDDFIDETLEAAA